LPGSLNSNRRLSQWISIHADGTVSLRSGKVELGQGIGTALAQIVADELDVDLSRIRRVAVNTAYGPNEGMTSGSLSIQDSGSALRQVCAEVRAIYLKAAASHLNLPPGQIHQLEVVDGDISLRGDISQVSTSYWALANDALLDCEASGAAVPKSADGLRVVGQSVQRSEIAGIVSGKSAFIHDMRLPGMLFGRVLQPPSPGAQLLDLDLSAVDVLPGVVTTVRDGSFIGVIASDEYAAVRALAKLAAPAKWREVEALPDMRDMPAFLRAQPAETTVVGEKSNANTGALPTTVAAAHNFQASYSRPFLAHASIGPSCAVALYKSNSQLQFQLASTLESPSASLDIWTHSQGIYHLRADLALVLSMPADNIRVQHVPGAGCYGHNGADDVACDAALLARAVPGRPVQVVWTREDELGCAPFGPAMSVELQANVGADGKIAHWQHEVWSNGHSMRPGRSATPVLLAATRLEKPFEKQVAINAPLAAGGGAERNAVPLYDFAQWRAVSHRVLTMPIRTSALRSLGAHCNVFATESFMDEIATQIGVDPLEFRLRHLTDPRARAVLEAAAAMANWSRRSGDHSVNDERKNSDGRGLAVTRYKNTGAYCAVVASVDASGLDARVKQLWIAVDVGLVVNPDGVVNQIEGGAIQTVSWVLKEAVQFDNHRILSTTWGDYPILRFSEVPKVQVQIINRSDQKSVGAGEATHGPVAAAIANALFDAIGVRVRNLPLNAENIQNAALAEG
jgi:CO/xanthine dehydrogenase Mo-binding subunit